MALLRTAILAGKGMPLEEALRKGSRGVISSALRAVEEGKEYKRAQEKGKRGQAYLKRLEEARGRGEKIPIPSEVYAPRPGAGPADIYRLKTAEVRERERREKGTPLERLLEKLTGGLGGAASSGKSEQLKGLESKYFQEKK